MILYLVKSGTFSFYNKSIGTFYRAIYSVRVCISHCVYVFSSHSFWASSSLDVPARVAQEEGHTRFLIHFLLRCMPLFFSRE